MFEYYKTKLEECKTLIGLARIKQLAATDDWVNKETFVRLLTEYERCKAKINHLNKLRNGEITCFGCGFDGK